MIRLRAVVFTLLSSSLVTGCWPNFDRHLATLDARKVEVVTAGEGQATVVFEAGLGADWSTWAPVAEQVSSHARVFAYSRPGYGGSEGTATPRDPRHVVEELRTLLSAQGYAPPYVLVGHSFGGAYMEYFAKAHAEEVAALVLVDPRHRDYAAQCEAARLEGCGIPAAAVAGLPAVQIAEIEGYAAAPEQIRAAGTFGAYPVRVLIATNHPPRNDAREALWRSMLTSLATEAVNGAPVVFEGAGHVLQAERVDAVTRAIVAVLPGPPQ